MGYATDGQLPRDANGFPAEGVYVPNVGTVAQQGVTVATDTQGTNYAATVVQTVSGSTTVLGAGNTGLPVNIPTIVQKNKAVSSGGVASQTCAFTSNNAAGNTLVVVCGVGNTGTITVSDSLSNTYTKVTTATQGSVQAGMFFVTNCAAGANTVTVTPSASVSVAVEIYELSGIVTPTLAPSQFSSGSNAGSTTASTSAISSGTPNGYAFLGVSVGTAAQAVSVSSGTTWTLDSTQNVGGTPSGLFTFGALSQFFDTIGPVTPQATLAGSENWAAVAAVFRPVALGVQGIVTIGGYNRTNITTGTTTLVKTGPGVLHAIAINKLVASATIEYDDAVTNTNSMGIITLPGTITALAPFSMTLDAAFATGLSITTSGATDVTVIWK